MAKVIGRVSVPGKPKTNGPSKSDDKSDKGKK
ncbi:hypothetical protein TRPE111910_11635 [Treponema peruense]|nr:MAG TPA: hypothetical protein [Caudoviricetes sp.]